MVATQQAIYTLTWKHVFFSCLFLLPQ